MGNSQLGVGLTGLDYFLIVVPLAVALFGWLALVFWADFHPDVRHVGEPRGRSVTGGTFRGEGRAVTPRRDAVPAEATLATRAAEENTPGEGGAAQDRPAAQPQDAGADPARAAGEPGEQA
jgi:hypothetical protein